MAIPTKQQQSTEEDTSVDVHAAAAPIRYLSLDDVYSATSPTCVTTASGSSSTLMSKKIKARKLLAADTTITSTTNTTVLNVENPKVDGGDVKKPKIDNFVERTDIAALGKRRRSENETYDSIRFVYTRRKKIPKCGVNKPSLFDALHARIELGLNRDMEDDTGEVESERDDKVETLLKKKKKEKEKKKSGGRSEVLQSGVGESGGMLSIENGPRLRENRRRNQDLSRGGGTCGNVKTKTRSGDSAVVQNVDKSLQTKKRWVRLSFDDADPKVFIGLQCKVFWPLDADWYTGHITGYEQETNKHHVKYEDDDEEDLTLTSEKIRFFISYEEMKRLNLRYGSKNTDSDLYDYEEMVVLAATMDEYQELEPGDIVWAKLTGYAMWPGILVDESRINLRGVSDKNHVGRSVSVQFFGTHDFARVNMKQVIPFLRGLISSFHSKSKKPRFIRALEEARTYLSEQKLPKRMRRLQNGSPCDDQDSGSDENGGREDSSEDCVNNVDIHGSLEYLGSPPYSFGDLRVVSLGRIVKGSQFFQDENCFWPEGYTAVRQFASLSDPSVSAPYKMEVLRDKESKDQPLFIVTSDKGEQFKGTTPTACWNKIYKRLKKINRSLSNGSNTEGGPEMTRESGSHMFGFCNPEVVKLIQGLSKSQVSSKFSTCKSSSKRCGDLPVGYRPVRVDWKDLDKCSVCHMDEEYANNLFLQCDKCRMMVHARCYGELEPVDGVLWLCNLCRPGAPDPPPTCCLCPVIGGAMKPTTDERWAHLACAMWIPETCLSDVKKMEPIDGISRINKDRWKLLCSICGVSYGACIQCSNNNCRVAYHPLCARAAGLCVELEDEDRLHLLSLDDDEENQCIRLLSFCKKHRQPSNERLGSDERARQVIRQCCDYDPPINPSGCARCEPYNYSRRRGRKEPEALAAASSKRLFVENQPYLVGGYGLPKLLGKRLSFNETVSKFSCSLQRLRAEQFDPADNVFSMAEKYKFMRETFRRRLAFGKSGIHGFGIFTKQPHRAGDMVIEYTGELVRPPIADRREHFIYNSLVGAGTYMFRIDDERVIDATRAGSIAHLINHSCEPNCYSRVISVNGDEHIIIFAKRDIKRWEELTYDYRFFSIDERLACYCGSIGCRGVVNDTEAEEQAAKLFVPRSELIEWKGE